MNQWRNIWILVDYPSRASVDSCLQARPPFLLAAFSPVKPPAGDRLTLTETPESVDPTARDKRHGSRFS
ncbi:unnamed protein product [Lactuca virosa]|uniref:Uncharacterized protein n=1 Tax=Lactuca virosa TaxID=75947 RepID=A0AAU9MC63_9ASTR|nr:unnamed protein product [Lactuca virosa]